MAASKLPVNCYVQRTAAKEGLCFICNKFTSSLLLTEHDTPRDWFYVCAPHLDSPSFCSKQIEASNDAAGPPKQNQVESLDNDKASTAAPAEAADGDNNKSSKNESTAASDSESTHTPAASTSPAVVQKPRYVLNSNYFYLRQRPFIQRLEQQRTEQLVRQLPNVPRHQPKSH
ncbi:hypothetical protein BX667DRAFT_516044 [Coemansia mojavensis]|nr:hypothetical protein BX667DRAFT_516044 [Coemansia mojavensis]